jgi:hypothetical protein
MTASNTYTLELTTMLPLWNSPDKYAPPTSFEAKVVKESIIALESQLEGAMAILDLARRNVAVLQQHIDERKAWLAPIRRIPHDILSVIFFYACREAWSAPLLLGQVCRVWRESIIATPMAWTHIPMDRFKSPQLLYHFLERSARCGLHLRVPPTSLLDPFQDIPNETVMDRTICLNINANRHIGLLRKGSPVLESLLLNGQAPEINAALNGPDPDYSFILDADHFPNLRSLAAANILDTVTWTTPPFSNFVPLQEFRVHSQSPSVWSMIVEICAKSLKRLAVTMRFAPMANLTGVRKHISLPCLEYLAIHDPTFESPSPWPIKAETPALQLYAEKSPYQAPGPTHNDTKTVTSLQVWQDTNLELFPNVVRMEISARDAPIILERLASIPELCPDLTTIIYEESDADLTEVVNRVTTRGSATDIKVRPSTEMKNHISLHLYPEVFVSMIISKKDFDLTVYLVRSNKSVQTILMRWVHESEYR